jgi:cation diffusion facilitator CzcD-associated flavoprotein CzcO
VNRALEIFGKKTKKQERVVIIGGGNVGLAVARALEKRGPTASAPRSSKRTAPPPNRRRRAGTHHRAATATGWTSTS